MKISYVMIVLNGMPFIQASLESIYRSAHEIIIVEGAIEVCKFSANETGSSQDDTIACIRDFPDPEKKIKLILGGWGCKDKLTMQNRALKDVTGDYVWLVDSDEVYKEQDIEFICKKLQHTSSISTVVLPAIHFWKGIQYIIDSKKLDAVGVHRIFRFYPGAQFISHRPPKMLLPKLKGVNFEQDILGKEELEKEGIRIYHYSYVFIPQVSQKIRLYMAFGWARCWGLDLAQWFKDCFLAWTPENRKEIEAKWGIWTCDRGSKTKLFTGTHPESIVRLFAKLRKQNMEG